MKTTVAKMEGTETIKTNRSFAATKREEARKLNKQAEEKSKAKLEAEAKAKADADAKAQAEALTASIEARVMTKDEQKALAFNRLASLHSVESLNHMADLFEQLNADAARVGAFVRSHGNPIAGERFDDRLADKARVNLSDKDGNSKGTSANERKGLAYVKYAGYAVSPQSWNDAPAKIKKAVASMKAQLKAFEAYGIKQNIVKGIADAS